MCQHRIYHMFFPPSSPVRTTLLSLLSDIFMRRILSPSFPFPLTYVCCFSCSIPKTTAISLHQIGSSWRLRRHWPVASLRLHPSAFRSTHAFALHVWPFLTPEFQEAHPSTKSGSLDNKYEYHSTSQSKERKSTAHVQTPSIACHAKRRWMSPSATPATQNEGGCRQVPRLPRKVPRRHRRPIRSKRATRASPMP